MRRFVGTFRAAATLGFVALAACQSGTSPLDPAPAGPTAGPLVTANGGGPVFYGSTTAGPAGASSLYRIDPATGAATLVGPIGYDRVGALDFHLPTGKLYATAQSDGGKPLLITIDPTTGKGRKVGPTGIGGVVADLAFRSDGTLFAYDGRNDPEHTIWILNLATGAGTLVGDTGLKFDGGNGIVFGNDGVLYHSNRTNAHTISPVTGHATLLTPWIAGDALKAADVDPETGTIYGIQGGGNSAGGGERLVIAHYATGTVTVIGPTGDGMDGFTVGPTCVSWGEALIAEIQTMGLPGTIEATLVGMVQAVEFGSNAQIKALKNFVKFLEAINVLERPQTKWFVDYANFCLAN